MTNEERRRSSSCQVLRSSVTKKAIQADVRTVSASDSQPVHGAPNCAASTKTSAQPQVTNAAMASHRLLPPGRRCHSAAKPKAAKPIAANRWLNRPTMVSCT